MGLIKTERNYRTVMEQSYTARENLDMTVIIMKRYGRAVFCRKTNEIKFGVRWRLGCVYEVCCCRVSQEVFRVLAGASYKVLRHTSAWYRLSIWNRASTQCMVTHSHTCSTFRYRNPVRREDYYFAAVETKLYWQPSDIFLFLFLSFSFFTHFNGPCARLWYTAWKFRLKTL